MDRIVNWMLDNPFKVIIIMLIMLFLMELYETCFL
jgi:hypothetical protein